MTVKEFRQALEKLEAEGHADEAMTVSIMGSFMCGYNAKVTGAFPGFDWESGQVLIKTDVQLGLYKEVQEARKEARKAKDATRKSTTDAG